MKSVRKDGLRQGVMKMTALEPKSKLVSRIGEQSPHFFATLGVGYSWLDEPVETWPENPDYQKLHKFAHHLPVDNAATERMIWRTFLYRNYGKRSEDHFQATLAVVGAAKSQLEHARQKKDSSKRLVKKIRSESCFKCFVFCI